MYRVLKWEDAPEHPFRYAVWLILCTFLFFYNFGWKAGEQLISFFSLFLFWSTLKICQEAGCMAGWLAVWQELGHIWALLCLLWRFTISAAAAPAAAWATNKISIRKSEKSEKSSKCSKAKSNNNNNNATHTQPDFNQKFTALFACQSSKKGRLSQAQDEQEHE